MLMKIMGDPILKFFTKEWYKEMQVYGLLAFHDTKEDWDEMLQYYVKEGIDFKSRARMGLEA
jgi:hypothetical protein